MNSRSHRNGFWQKIRQWTDFQWVLISQLFVVVPHSKNLPTWLVVYALVVILMQLPPLSRWLPKKIFAKRALQLIQYTGFIAGLIGLYLTYRTAFGLEVGIAFLLLCAVSKLLELHTRRDAYVVLTLSLFVLAGLFLVEQDLLTTLIVMMSSLMVLFAMIAQNDDGTGRLRTLGLLVVQAIPLTVILFLFFPRLPPLWSVQLGGQTQATTGMSDSMSPGDFSQLSQSTELAFRVEFSGKMPARQDMYWRGLVFTDFDGVTWRPSKTPQQYWYTKLPEPIWLTQTLSSATPPKVNDGKSYRVILEKTGQSWLFGLDYPFSQQRGVRVNADFTLQHWDKVYQRLTYQVYWLNDALLDVQLSPQQRAENLQLPTNGNEQSRQFAKNLFVQSGNDPIKFAHALEHWIKTQQFRYTLSPPRLKDNRIDEFLFQTRAGFCEHYSSSFTYMMRAVGVPARVVVGYQGGQLGRDGNSWEIRQMDAHAWSEIWVEGRGWVRFDPTAFISPDRVELGMDNLTQTTGAIMFGDGIMGQISYQQFQLVQQARRLFDQASYYWQRDVIGYDQDNQKSSLLQWFNIQSLYQQVMVMVMSFVVVLSLIALWLWWKRRQVWNKYDWLMIRLSKRLAKQQPILARQNSEGVLIWLDRIRPISHDPALIDEIKQLYRQQRYSEQAHDRYQTLKQLTKSVQLKRE